MNNLTPLEIETMLIHLDQSVKTLTELMTSVIIDKQKWIEKNTPIPPGIGCKFAYDTNGLVLKNMGLEISDIPKLPISKIDGLERYLQDIATSNDLKRLKIDILNNRLKKGDVVESGMKVSIDSNGLVVSVSDLLPTDIPQLPISKIDGLKDELEIIASGITSFNSIENDNTYKIQSGVFPKVTFDNQGRVIKGEPLSITDIPNELISKVNELESIIPTLASRVTLDSINNKLLDKIDKNDDIIPGEYFKVRVDSKGLVIKGNSTLSKSDLPKLSISDIEGLESSLRNKVDVDLYTTLNNSVSSLVSSISKINEVTNMKNLIGKKANEEDLMRLSSKVNSLQNTINNINDSSSDIVMSTLENINKELSNINGRLSILEKKLS